MKEEEEDNFTLHQGICFVFLCLSSLAVNNKHTLSTKYLPTCLMLHLRSSRLGIVRMRLVSSAHENVAVYSHSYHAAGTSGEECFIVLPYTLDKAVICRWFQLG